MWDYRVVIAGQISIHALRVEGDSVLQQPLAFRPYFYPRPPGGGRPLQAAPDRRRCDFYPRPPGGGRPLDKYIGFEMIRISIHALRVEGDDIIVAFHPPNGISIHALRVEGDRKKRHSFLFALDFYPRPPGGGRRIRGAPLAPAGKISIHALRVEGDFRSLLIRSLSAIFLSTPSGWRATRSKASIMVYSNFYPRPPGGGRPAPFGNILAAARDFYPRPPGGGRPKRCDGRLVRPKSISIHALRVEGDAAPVSAVPQNR